MKVLPEQDKQPEAVEMRFKHAVLPAVCACCRDGAFEAYVFSSTGDLLCFKHEVSAREGHALKDTGRQSWARLPLHAALAKHDGKQGSQGGPHSSQIGAAGPRSVHCAWQVLLSREVFSKLRCVLA